MNLVKINDQLWDIVQDGVKIGHVDRVRKPSAFGGCWFNYVYVNGIKKGFFSKHPSRMTEKDFIKFQK